MRKAAGGEIPIWSTMGMDVVDVRAGWAQVRVRFSRTLINSNGVVHGGVLFSAADAATAVALLGLLEDGDLIATTEMKINFIKAVDGRDVVAEAHILHRGKRTAVGDVTVRDSAGNLVAKALTTYAIAKSDQPKTRRSRRKGKPT
jgi:acyl-CoA thioesterase